MDIVDFFFNLASNRVLHTHSGVGLLDKTPISGSFQLRGMGREVLQTNRTKFVYKRNFLIDTNINNRGEKIQNLFEILT